MENNTKRFYNANWFMWVTLFLFAPVGIFLMWKNRRLNTVVRIILSIFFAFVFIIAFFGDISDNSTNTVGKGSEISSQDEKDISKELESKLTFEGELEIEVVGNKVIMTIDTNVPDGGIFEVAILNGDMNMISDYVPVSSGKVVKEFLVPEDWKMGYYGAIAFLRFNLKEVKQPDYIIEFYGKDGEKMKGNLVQVTDSGGKNGMPDNVVFPYPSKQAIEETFYGLLDELIEMSDGLVLNIQPHYKEGDWKSVAVTLSDEWYDGADYEKERVAETIAEVIQGLVIGAGFVEEDSLVHVHFYDSYQKKLASPKMFGGYKIER